MKITNSVRGYYQAQLEQNELLAQRVGDLFNARKQPGWFYYGRVKTVESYAQKLETGRAEPKDIDDFFACTLVVENRTAIAEAIAVVEDICTIHSRKPPVAGETHKRPDEFPFDDLRLYVQLKQPEALEPSMLTDLLFEVQIKTFLQHAWGIATHDLIYKGESVHWGRSRVAYQIKAMLEHAEVSIAEVSTISQSESLSTTDRATKDANLLLEWLRDSWEPEQLPRDRVRLVRTLMKLLEGMNLAPEDLIVAVRKETSVGLGTKLRNLSPYGIAVRALFAHRSHEVTRFLEARFVRGSARLFITEEMELGPIADTARPQRFRLLPVSRGGIESEEVVQPPMELE